MAALDDVTNGIATPVANRHLEHVEAVAAGDTRSWQQVRAGVVVR